MDTQIASLFLLCMTALLKGGAEAARTDIGGELCGSGNPVSRIVSQESAVAGYTFLAFLSADIAVL